MSFPYPGLVFSNLAALLGGISFWIIPPKASKWFRATGVAIIVGCVIGDGGYLVTKNIVFFSTGLALQALSLIPFFVGVIRREILRAP